MRATGLQAGEEELPDLMPPIVLPEDTRGKEIFLHQDWSKLFVCVYVLIQTESCSVYLNKVGTTHFCGTFYTTMKIQRAFLIRHPCVLSAVFAMRHCSIFLTQDSLRTTPWSPALMTHLRWPAGFLHVCMNANTTGTLNYWQHFWTFIFNYPVLLFILKGHWFPWAAVFDNGFYPGSLTYSRHINYIHEVCRVLETPFNVWDTIYHILASKVVIQCCFVNWLRRVLFQSCHLFGRCGIFLWQRQMIREIVSNMMFCSRPPKFSLKGILNGVSREKACSINYWKVVVFTVWLSLISYNDFMRSPCNALPWALGITYLELASVF